LLRCAMCGGPMSGSTKGRAGEPARYYGCSDRRRYGSCQAPHVRADVLERELCDWLAKCQLGDQVEAATRQLVERGLRGRRTAVQDLRERHSVKELEARIERLTKAWAVYGTLNEADYRAEVDRARAEIAKARAVPELPTIRHLSQRLTDLVQAWHDATSEQRARLAAAIVAEIHVDERHIVAIRPRLALAPYFEELVATDGQ